MGLSDGMGYGTSACLESETVIELLEQLLDSGFDPECALENDKFCYDYEFC